MKGILLSITGLIVIVAIVYLNGKAMDDEEKGDKTGTYILYAVVLALLLISLFILPDGD